MTGKQVLAFIDLYSAMKNIQKTNTRRAKPVNYNYSKEPFMFMIDELKALNADVNIDLFIENLSRVRNNGVFKTVEEANLLLADFRKLSIDIPSSLNYCFEEVVVRNNFLSELILSKEFDWTTEQKASFLVNTEKAINEEPDDIDIRRKYLLKAIDQTNKDIYDCENIFYNDYRCNLNLYSGLTFIANKEGLNSLFYHCLVYKKESNHSHVKRTVLTYIDNKNKLKNLQDLLDGEEVYSIPALEDIFDYAKNGYTLCRNLLEKLRIIDSSTKTRLTRGIGNTVAGLIAALRESDLLKRKYSENEMLLILNKSLGTSFYVCKKSSAGYKEAYEFSKTFLSMDLKSLPSVGYLSSRSSVERNTPQASM